MNEIETAAEALRRAAACGEFETAAGLATRYTALAVEHARGLDPRSPEFEKLRDEGRELLSRVREMAIAERAHAAARLQQLMTARQYEAVALSSHITETLG